MVTDPQVELRLARLENDSSSLYELIADIQATLREHDRRFDGMDRRFDGIDQRLGGIDQRLGGIDQRLGGIDQHLGGIDQQLETINLTLAEVVRRLPSPA